MHALDAVGFVLGDPVDVRAAMAVGQHDVHLAATGARVPVTAPDQVAINGRLPGDGGILSPFYRGGTSRAENFRWAITGTEGELLLTSSTPGHGNIQTIDLELTGAFGLETEMAALTIPDFDPPVIAQLNPGPARNVARLYAAFADDLAFGRETVPNFATRCSDTNRWTPSFAATRIGRGRQSAGEPTRNPAAEGFGW